MKKKIKSSSKNKNTALKTTVFKIAQAKKGGYPQLLLVVGKIKEKFGNNVIGFGNKLDNVTFDKLLNSNDITLLQEKTDELRKKYQQITKQLTACAKAKNTNAKKNKKKQLVKQREEIKKIYIAITQKVKSFYNKNTTKRNEYEKIYEA
ncbi:hypothetical protein [Rickettsia endosymbiont of Cardiosporidium cionae]|uniref:hypothetical protein n=1 Tax=Rickettsia endosymbiont of Cardiosporidium cionae TaxID=2777155 RepID=UPI001895562E|nr:hypothetical protein [Rickettsia endosymbiont of Cardiosporidium cionae]KAF8818048.1 hypothetical protein IHI24_000913 [Rickettsia endosymbiont of Cardiosporidium cionae]